MLAGDFAKTEAQATLLQKRINSIRTDALKGGLLLGAGVGMLALFKTPLDEAKKFQTEVARFTALGLGAKTNTDAVKFANGMNIMGSSARDNMKLLREATTIMGSLEHAKEVTPFLSKMKFGIESVMADGHGEKFESMFQAVLKTAELRGAVVNRATGNIDAEKFKQVTNLMTQAYVASGGLVKPQDYLAAIKTGGVSTKLMSDEMFFLGLGHFMQESGGSRTGTASMSMFQNWAMGRMPQRVAEDMAQSGLLEKSALHYGTTGHIKRVDAMGIKNADLFTQSPFEWVNKILVPKLQEQGFAGDKLNIKLASLLGIRTASNLADQFVREEVVARNYTQRAKKAVGVEGLYNLAGSTLQGKEVDLHAKYKDLMLALGNTVLPLAIKALEALIPAVKSMSDWVGRNHGLVRGLTGAFIALAAGLAIRGAVLLLSAAFRGLGLALAFGAIGGASKITALGGILMKFGSGLVAIATTVMTNPMVLGVLAAAGAGYAAGTVLNKGINSAFGPNQSLGGWIYDKTHADPGRTDFVAKKAQAPVIVNHTTQLDGRTLFKSNTYHAGKALNGPQFGTGKFDGGLMPSFAGASR